MSSTSTKPPTRLPAWIGTLYFAEGVPYMIATAVSVVMLKSLSMSNANIAFWTSWLGLPWIIKPLWTPIVDIYGSKRLWIVGTEFAMAALFALAAFAMPLSWASQALLALFMVLAFLSATHDASADGFYIIALDSHSQAALSGVRSAFYRCAMIASQGGLVMLAGLLDKRNGDIRLSWLLCLALVAAVFVGLGLYHQFMLPRPSEESAKRHPEALTGALQGFIDAFASFFRKPGVITVLAFILLYRFAEAQLLKLFAPFMLDPRVAGGLGLGIAEQGFIYGTVGIVCLLLGGIAGGFAVARHGLGRWLLPMCLIMNTPDLLFVYLSQFQPEGLLPVALCVAIEQLGYGFGFTAFMIVMLQFAEDSGPYKTSHYALMTGFMALGMMLPGMFAGKLQEMLGYRNFFLWVLVCVIPSIVATLCVKRIIRRDFGVS